MPEMPLHRTFGGQMEKISKLLLAGCILLSCTTHMHKSQAIVFATNPVVAHRGAWKKNGFPENSIASLREAIRMNCAGSEFDVRMTADDTLIINHDPAYQGLDIEKSTYAQLSATKLKNGETIPTLREYLISGMRDNNGTRLVLEIKASESGKERSKLLAERVVKLVHDMHAESWIVYISFDFDILRKVIETDPNANTQYLEGNKTATEMQTAGFKGADLHFSVYHAKPTLAVECRQAGLALNAWTVNDANEMNWLIGQQFDFITTNEPELLFRLLEKQ